MAKDHVLNEHAESQQSDMFVNRPLTNERVAFVEGLFSELEDQTQRYLELVAEEQKLQAKVAVTEGNLQSTRDFIRSQLQDTDEDVPANWEGPLQKVRFVGSRIGDACVQVLREAAETEKSELTSQEILHRLNSGQFRFRTGYPLREIHAALIRNSRVDRVDELWKWKSDSEPSVGKLKAVLTTRATPRPTDKVLPRSRLVRRKLRKVK